MSYLRCSVPLYLQLFVGGLMSYLRYQSLFTISALTRCSVPLYLQLCVGGLMSYLRCSVPLYLQLFVGGLMSYLPPVICRRAHVLFTLLVFVYVQWYPTHIVLCFVFLRLVSSFSELSIFDLPFGILLWLLCMRPTGHLGNATMANPPPVLSISVESDFCFHWLSG